MSKTRDELASGRHYRLAHRTRYTYPEVVTSSYGRAVMLPRDGAGQQVHTSALHISPRLNWRWNRFGPGGSHHDGRPTFGPESHGAE